MDVVVVSNLKQPRIETYPTSSKRKESAEIVEDTDPKSESTLKIDSASPPSSMQSAYLSQTSLIKRFNPENRREETYMEKLKDIGTNLKYTIGGLSETITWRANSSDRYAYVLGRRFDTANKAENQAMEVVISKIIWFSYRKNFQKIECVKNAKDENTFVSDTGWGCMVRACQMALVQALKMGLEMPEKQKSPSKLKIFDIISWFLDEKKSCSAYSIHNICSQLYLQGLLPGTWYKASNVLHAMMDIYNKHEDSKTLIQFEVFVDGTIYLDQLKDIVLPEEEKEHSNSVGEDVVIVEDDEEKISKKIFDWRISKNLKKILTDATPQEMEELEKLLTRPWKKPLLIIALAKIGLDKVSPQYIEGTKSYLSYEECTGMIVGKPGLAYYAPGYQDDHLLYLDPHFVQETLPFNDTTVKHRAQLVEKYQYTYFCKNVRHLKFTDIDTSVGLCFYIKDSNQFGRFLEKFAGSADQESSYLSLAMTTPTVSKLYSSSSHKVENEFEHI